MTMLVAQFECTSRVLKNDIKVPHPIRNNNCNMRQLVKQEKKLDE